MRKKAIAADGTALQSVDSYLKFPVAGIGASAGGLDAFKMLLKAIPENSGIAWVLVQHQHPGHESMLTELLQKVTPIPVFEITNGILLKPNCIFVMPPNKMLVASGGKLILSPRPDAVKMEGNYPINMFFESLALSHEGNAIGVVLSGTASDGTKGLRAIKDHGGITIAQSVASAAYAGMPESAIAAGVADFILAPEKIPKKLLEIKKIIGKNDEQQSLPDEEEKSFKQILYLLHTSKGMDFTYYKQTTIRRRILRRVLLNKFKKVAEYANFLKENSGEVNALYHDMLIPVTSFFRDTKVFDNLCETVFPNLIKNKSPEGHIRIWVAGCSTGEEAYSIAICFKEYLGHKNEKVQIFATDLSEPAIAKARAGIYTKSEAEMVSHNRLKKFFTVTHGNYLINKDLRDMCVFAVHNFLKEPPFGKIDFISCRNVLIYMDTYLQKKALTTFHYALNPKGLLMLGRSENTIGITDLFMANNKTEKVFTRKDVASKIAAVSSKKIEPVTMPVKKGTMPEPVKSDFQKLADDIILNQYTPPGVVVNEGMDIVHFRGNTSLYLEQLPGKPTHNLLKMAKPGLAFELRSILHRAIKEKKPVKKENVPVQIQNIPQLISLEAIPLNGLIEPHYFVVFNDSIKVMANGAALKPPARNRKDEDALRLQQLEKELAQLREDMRSITEDQEATNEELQSTNEELLSSNEELQSLNEELETSKEELQSTIEEITVVNQEVVNLNEQLGVGKEYAEAIIATIPQPMLVLDASLKVSIANQLFYQKFLVTPSQTEGRLVYDIGNRQWDIPKLKTLLENILPQQESFFGFEVEHVFNKIGLRIMRLNAREILRDKGEKRILLVIEDVTDYVQATRKIAESEHRYREMIATSSSLISVLEGENLLISIANDATLAIWGRGKEVIGQPLLKVFPEFETQGFGSILKNVLSTGETFTAYEMPIEIMKNGEKFLRYYNFSYQAQKNLDGKITGILSIAYEVTSQALLTQKIKESEEKFRTMAESSDILIGVNNETVDAVYFNKTWEKLTGRPVEDLLKLGWADLLHPEDKEPFLNKFLTAFKNKASYDGEFRMLNKEGMYCWLYTKAQVRLHPDGSYAGHISSSIDITDRKTNEKALQESEEKIRTVIENSPFPIGVYIGKELRIEFANQSILDIWGKGNNVIGKRYSDILPELENQKVFGQLLDVLVTGIPFQAINQRIELLVNSVVRPYYFNYNFTPLRNSAGEVYGVMNTAADVTDLNIAKQQAEESQEQFATLADNMENLAWIANGDGWIYWYNKRWYQYTGTTLEEMQGWGWEKVHHPDHKERVVDFVTKAWLKTEPFELTFPLLGADGNYKWFLTRVYPILNNEGKILRWIGTNTDIDEQKKAGEQFRLLADQAPMWVFTCDVEVNITYANKELLQFIGLTTFEEFKGHVWKQIVHEGDIENILSLFNKAYLTRSSFEIEVRIKNAATNLYEWFYFRNVPTFQKEIFTGFIGTSININAQKLQMSALIESEQLFRSLTDIVPSIIWITGPDGYCNYLNEQWYGYTGQSHAEGEGYGWLNAIHPEDKDRAGQEFIHANENKIAFTHNYRLKSKEGEYRWVIDKGSPKFSISGMYEGMIGTVVDIHDEKTANDLIKKNEERFRLLANAMPQQVWTADAEGKLNYFNQSVYDFSGLTLAEISKDGWLQIVHPDERDENIIEWTNAIKNGTDFLFEHRFRRHDGGYRWQLSRAVPQKDADGNITVWIGTSTDIQKIKEEEKRKDDFLKMVSHELKTPVTSIKGYVQFLLSLLSSEMALPPALSPVKSSLVRIDIQIIRLTRLITEMLDLSRIESGKLDLQHTVFSINDMALETIRDISHTSTTHLINLQQDFSGTVAGDRNRLEQVLINFINNAIKYSPESNVIDVRIYKTDKNLVAVSVQDYGIGISKEDQANVFERFYRVEGKREEIFSGFGIGLFIANEIIQRHHGIIMVESELAKGSTFTFMVPAIA